MVAVRLLALFACMLGMPHIPSVNTKQRRLLRLMFTDPVPGSIVCCDIEALLRDAGADVVEDNGSRVRFVCKGVVGRLSSPTPREGGEAL